MQVYKIKPFWFFVIIIFVLVITYQILSYLVFGSIGFPFPIFACTSDRECPRGEICIVGDAIWSPVAGPPAGTAENPGRCTQLPDYGGFQPVCLSGGTLIDTPSGPILVEKMKIGMPVWTVDKNGHRQSAVVLKKVSKYFDPGSYLLYLQLDDRRKITASPAHPTSDNRKIGDLKAGDILDGSKIISINKVFPSENITYDILPSGETGLYYANGILLKSTLFK